MNVNIKDPSIEGIEDTIEFIKLIASDLAYRKKFLLEPIVIDDKYNETIFTLGTVRWDSEIQSECTHDFKNYDQGESRKEGDFEVLVRGRKMLSPEEDLELMRIVIEDD